MHLSKEAIEEFKRIYKKVEGKDISDKKALELATSLITMFKAVYRPIPKEDEKKFKKIVEEQDRIEKNIKHRRKTKKK